MNIITPSHKQIIKLDDYNIKVNSLSTPIEVNKYFNKILIPKYNENQIHRYKTITQQRKNNNINGLIKKPQQLFRKYYNNPNKITTESNNNDKRERITYKKKILIEIDKMRKMKKLYQKVTILIKLKK